ncbi:exodeoxyribonuclease VII small subunit [Natronospira proteinivora]|uniref:Exodeoxyribonuclease 7 small subunit n=1 Tax=Natronospira proteinivora TaxID=1807133 RepID=A0ABT1G759_9GAMM|nr:exodeoxyribonuclease VII small subunit [Natronospira proteinivora]MCP1727131.1 exodeoxyribonuclease VII small subunit [Natronospira proteinivora]
MAEKKDKQVDFEQSLNELEALVERLEGGDLSLEESLKAFESGVALTRQCRDALTQAEQKIQKLSGNGEDTELSPFEEDEDGESN